MIPFPKPIWGFYPVTEYYYITGLDGSYQCMASDKQDRYMNVLCSDYSGSGEFVNGLEYDCTVSNVSNDQSIISADELGIDSECTYQHCSDIPSKFCKHGPLTLWGPNGSDYIGVCDKVHVSDRTCSPLVNDIGDRPIEDMQPPGVHSHRWYVGSPDFTIGYSYKCDAEVDSSDGGDYYNALCGTQGHFDPNIHVYCNGGNSDTSIFAETHKLPTASDEVLITSPYCGATSCDQLAEPSLCEGGLDLYIYKSDKLTYAYTCVSGSTDGKDVCKDSGGLSYVHIPYIVLAIMLLL